MKSPPPGISPIEFENGPTLTTGRQSPDPSRRETIMSLVEMLLQNNGSDEMSELLSHSCTSILGFFVYHERARKPPNAIV